MLICYVINSLDGGGAALPLPDLIGVMREAGHDVFVVSLRERDGRARGALEAAGIEHHVIGGREKSYPRTAVRLQRIVRARRPGLLWTSLAPATITGEIVGALHGIPVVSWMHNTGLKPINLLLLRRMHRLTRHWVADSTASARFGSTGIGIDPSRISLWPPFIADPDAPMARQIAAPRFRFGSLGRLHRNKGYDVLIRALADLRSRDPTLAEQLSVTIAGEGGQADELRALARDLQVENIEFPGFVSDPQDFLSGLHAYLQPSCREGLCVAAHEAMQAGLPLIATPVGEMEYSLRASGGGLLVPCGDFQALSLAIEALIADSARAAEMGRAGRAWVQAAYSREQFRARGIAALTAGLRNES